jgi:DNA-binding transcriptional ArsR family regulator
MPVLTMPSKNRGAAILNDPRAAKALTHPLRARLLTELSEESSPKELAIQLGESLGKVSYHIRELERLGCIEQTRVRPVRGAVEHFYRATVRLRIELEDI